MLIIFGAVGVGDPFFFGLVGQGKLSVVMFLNLMLLIVVVPVWIKIAVS